MKGFIVFISFVVALIVYTIAVGFTEFLPFGWGAFAQYAGVLVLSGGAGAFAYSLGCDMAGLDK